MPSVPKSRAARALLPAAVFLVPFLVFLAGPYSGSGDTEPAELLPISILLDHRLDFDRFYGGRQDLPYPYRRVRGHVVSAYPIVAGLANVPVYAAARILRTDLYAARSRLSHVTAALLAAASVLFLYGTLRRVCRSRREALLFAGVYAFGTEVLAVAGRGAWQHAPSLFFLSASLWLLWPKPADDRLARESGALDPVWRVPLSGLTLAVAVVSRPTNVLLAGAAAAFVLASRRKRLPLFLLFLFFAAIPAAAVTLYSAVWLANPLALGQLYRPFGFGGHPLRGLAGLLASPSRGLFVFSPVLLASLPGAWIAWRSRERRYEPLPWLTAGAAATLLLFSFWGMWWGGSSFGYRLVVDVVPVLTILSAVGWRLRDPRRERARGRAFLFAALFALSVYVEILGVFAYPTRFGEGLDLEPERLWDVRESELVLASRQLFGLGAAPARDVAPVWWAPEKNDDAIPGWIDESPGSRTIRGTLSVSGWAKSAAGEVEVAIAFDGGPVVTPLRYPRSDVASVLPELGDTATAGFRADVPAASGALRDRAMTVELKEPGGRVRRIGPIRFRWGPML
ncbi:MAG: hypothetical protein ABJC61_13200 [Acidobacteriota bacterium]